MKYLCEKLHNKFIYRQLIRRRLLHVGKNFRLGYHSEIGNPEFISIGDNFYSGPYTLMTTNRNNPVVIEENVMFGSKCSIIGGNHDMSFCGFMSENQELQRKRNAIIIEKGAWIGTDSTLLSGSHLCEGVVIGAKSLVNSYIPPFVVAAGIPARVLKPRFNTLDEIKLTLSNTNSRYTLDEVIAIHREHKIDYS